MRITEIAKIRDYDPSENLENVRLRFDNLPKSRWQKIPGDNPFYRANVTYDGSPAVIVALHHAEEWRAWPWFVVGALITEKSPKIDNYYNQNVYSVMSIGVEPEMRGQGIARHLYDGYLLPPPDGLDSILFSGDSQTTGGRAMWTNLKSRPDIEVTGYVKVPNWMPEYSDQQMITFFNKVGGAYLGHLGDDWYFEFPVEKLPNKRELEIAIKGSGVKVYSGNEETGLMARYLG